MKVIMIDKYSKEEILFGAAARKHDKEAINNLSLHCSTAQEIQMFIFIFWDSMGNAEF